MLRCLFVRESLCLSRSAAQEALVAGFLTFNYELLTVFGCVEKNPGEDDASYTRDKAPIWNHLTGAEKKKLTEFVEGSNQHEVLLCAFIN